MVNQRIDGDDIERLEQDNRAEERQKRFLTALAALTGVGNKTAEAKRKGDATGGAADKQT